jgi:Lrp/AsnC family leucine-responsive transcriptional regulator
LGESTEKSSLAMLDDTDKKILNLLQDDCKRTNKEIASRLDLSVTAVFERIKKLERKAVISSYVALVDKSKVNMGFTVFCHIKLVQHVHKSVTDFEREVVKLKEVLECFHVSGEYDYLLKVVVRDMEHFRSFMVSKLTTLEHIGSTQSSFSINEVKNSTALSF